MSHGLFCRSPFYVSGPWLCKDPCCLWEGQKALRFHQKHLNLCSEDERRSYGFGTTWGRVINDRIFIFGWAIPLIISLFKLFFCSRLLNHIILLKHKYHFVLWPLTFKKWPLLFLILVLCIDSCKNSLQIYNLASLKQTRTCCRGILQQL